MIRLTPEVNETLDDRAYSGWWHSIFLPGAVALCITTGSSVNAGEMFDNLLSRFFSPETCIGNIDWFEVGLSDGKLGFERGYFAVYEESCSRRSRAPDKQAYFKAYSIGIHSYCDPSNIYQLALRGSVVTSPCEQTPALRAAVRQGFEDLQGNKIAANR